jgi:hypothetical protein
MIRSSEPWSSPEKESTPLSYRCELIFGNALDINTYNLPSDSYLIYYRDKEGEKVDICRAARMVDVFDLYYDRFGGVIKKIDYSNGRVNPRVWGQNKKKEEEVTKKK